MESLKSSSLQAHFTDLRKRLLNSILSVGLAFLICWVFSEDILNFLRRPIQPFLIHTNGGLIFTGVMELFMAHLQVSVFAGVFLSSPYWLKELWKFISPGLYQSEKKVFLLFWFLACILFFLGAVFGFYVVFPVAFSLLLQFGAEIDQSFITISNYLSFVMRFLLVLALLFEMPLVCMILVKTGLLSSSALRKYRRHAIVALSILSAFATPPDVLSLFILWLPLIGLYEISIFLSSFLEKKN